ncbi:hypothetical protein FRC08_001418 [Ceratobasidium sp. 394]|nr:hypothetical protein FRC08_001418 [Ceratobasidium sp. 394]
MNLAWLAINTVYLFAGKVNYTSPKPNPETHVAPIKIRIQQRIAQVTVPTIPNAPALSDVPYRYICPTVCLATLLAVLVLTVGVSAKLACLVCFVVCAIAIAGDRMGVVEEEEGPQVGAGLTAAPHEQT